MVKKFILWTACVFFLFGCDYGVGGSINNKTDSDVRIVCHLADRKYWQDIERPAYDDFSHPTREHFFAVNDINACSRQYVRMNDSVYYVILLPGEALRMKMPMNYFWSKERLNCYLQFLRRMEIQMPGDTISYNGASELNDFFWEHKESETEICINIRNNSFLKMLDDIF